MLSVGFFGGSVRPSSPGMPRPHRSPPPFFAWRTTEDPKRPPRDPKRPSRRYKMLSGSSPQQLCTPNPSAAPSCRPSSPNASPGAFGSPNTTHRDPEYPSQSPLRTPQTHPGTQRTPGMPNAISRDPPGHPNTPRSPPPPILTAPVLLLSALQSGMILDSCTIQLLILSLLRRSTARAKRGGHGRGGGGRHP